MSDAVVPVGKDVSSGSLERVPDTKVSRPSDVFDKVTRFIKEVGFPIAVAAVLIAYMWFIGSKTNEHLSKGSEIMIRAVNVLEKLERKVGP